MSVHIAILFLFAYNLLIIRYLYIIIYNKEGCEGDEKNNWDSETETARIMCTILIRYKTTTYDYLYSPLQYNSIL